LEPYYSLVAPPRAALQVCLNKWETYRAAVRAGVAAPRCWCVEDLREVEDLASQLKYPCVLKPLSPHQWRQGNNWDLVGARKAIAIQSDQDLLLEYRMVARAEKSCVIQELVPGGDECLFVQACYLDRGSGYVAGFNVQKLVQVPEAFGTGCIVQGADRPELLEPTKRLLQDIGFAGVAEVEYKWDASAGEYKLIEINSRPWDQHRLGASCGIDLIYLAYCEHAGLPAPSAARGVPGTKWVAEDTLATTVLQLLWRRDPRLRSLLRHARGNRIYGIWSLRDPLPFLVYLLTRFLPDLFRFGASGVWRTMKTWLSAKNSTTKRGLIYESQSEK
jgi:D-aspartate ligase